MDGWTKVAILPRGPKNFSLVTVVCKDAKFIFMCNHQLVSILYRYANSKTTNNISLNLGEEKRME